MHRIHSNKFLVPMGLPRPSEWSISSSSNNAKSNSTGPPDLLCGKTVYTMKQKYLPGSSEHPVQSRSKTEGKHPETKALKPNEMRKGNEEPLNYLMKIPPWLKSRDEGVETRQDPLKAKQLNTPTVKGNENKKSFTQYHSSHNFNQNEYGRPTEVQKPKTPKINVTTPLPHAQLDAHTRYKAFSLTISQKMNNRNEYNRLTEVQKPLLVDGLSTKSCKNVDESEYKHKTGWPKLRTKCEIKPKSPRSMCKSQGMRDLPKSEKKTSDATLKSESALKVESFQETKPKPEPMTCKTATQETATTNIISKSFQSTFSEQNVAPCADLPNVPSPPSNMNQEKVKNEQQTPTPVPSKTPTTPKVETKKCEGIAPKENQPVPPSEDEKMLDSMKPTELKSRQPPIKANEEIRMTPAMKEISKDAPAGKTVPADSTLRQYKLATMKKYEIRDRMKMNITNPKTEYRSEDPVRPPTIKLGNQMVGDIKPDFMKTLKIKSSQPKFTAKSVESPLKLSTLNANKVEPSLKLGAKNVEPQPKVTPKCKEVQPKYTEKKYDRQAEPRTKPQVSKSFPGFVGSQWNGKSESFSKSRKRPNLRASATCQNIPTPHKGVNIQKQTQKPITTAAPSPQTLSIMKDGDNSIPNSKALGALRRKQLASPKVQSTAKLHIFKTDSNSIGSDQKKVVATQMYKHKPVSGKVAIATNPWPLHARCETPVIPQQSHTKMLDPSNVNAYMRSSQHANPNLISYVKNISSQLPKQKPMEASSTSLYARCQVSSDAQKLLKSQRSMDAQILQPQRTILKAYSRSSQQNRCSTHNFGTSQPSRGVDKSPAPTVSSPPCSASPPSPTCPPSSNNTQTQNANTVSASSSCVSNSSATAPPPKLDCVPKRPPPFPPPPPTDILTMPQKFCCSIFPSKSSDIFTSISKKPEKKLEKCASKPFLERCPPPKAGATSPPNLLTSCSSLQELKEILRVSLFRILSRIKEIFAASACPLENEVPKSEPPPPPEPPAKVSTECSEPVIRSAPVKPPPPPSVTCSKKNPKNDYLKKLSSTTGKKVVKVVKRKLHDAQTKAAIRQMEWERRQAHAADGCLKSPALSYSEVLNIVFSAPRHV